jgi:hypothetical protein
MKSTHSDVAARKPRARRVAQAKISDEIIAINESATLRALGASK